ncbi:MAG: murein peptide amidase A [Candidatus Hydrogenedentes bacterium ADurb.Bin179]|nr:MAG: murein peptide amidase A [Candidatus Hydrogenedentes bacterium ADurb.Bin179]
MLDTATLIWCDFFFDFRYGALFSECDRLYGMSRKRKILLAVMLLATAVGILTGCLVWKWAPFSRPTAPPEPVRSFDKLRQRMERLAAASDALTIRTLGEVSYNGSSWPLLLISRTPKGPIRLRALLTGGIHGNEPAGTECLMQFLETLSRDASAYPGIVFDIMPVVNPWGWVHGRRRNGNNRDLNREFTTFKAQESVFVREVRRQTHYDVMVDLHEDSHVNGFYLYRLANPDTELCRAMAENVQAGGYPIHDGRVMTIFRARDGMITSPLWTLRLARGIRQLSMSNYFRLEGCPRTFLFESPRRLEMKSRVAAHRLALEALLERAAGTKKTKMQTSFNLKNSS